MREHLATFLEDFRRFDRGVAVVRIVGNRRRATTYVEIAGLAGRFATYLADMGIGPDDRVVLWAENSAEWIAAFYGIMLRGALSVPLDAYGSADFAVRVALDVNPKLIIGDSALLRQLPDEWSKLNFEAWTDCLPREETGPLQSLGLKTPLQILFTSGTTGEPKGIVHTHENVLTSIGPIAEGARPYTRYEKLVHPLRILHTLPLSHVFGQTMGLWVPAIFAAEVHFENKPVASRLIETIKCERISVLAAVPRVMALLKTSLETKLPELEGRLAAVKNASPWIRWWRFRDVHWSLGLKFWVLISGGGALPEPLEQFWNKLGFVVVQGYGMTETTALVTLNHPFHVASGTIGRPLPGREVKLAADGEVLVRGAMISSAIWSSGKLQANGDQWLATGDLALRQETGELKFLGRKSEVIVTSAGLNIYPEDLENALEQEDGVRSSAVVPFDSAVGIEPFAVLALEIGRSNASEIVERTNARLPAFQWIRRWAIWPEPDLPRTSTGKVKRREVAVWLAASANESRLDPGDMNLHAREDWLLTLIAQISGETPPAGDDELLLSEDLHLDSLGRVQLAAALEERLGAPPEDGALQAVRTLGELRNILDEGQSTSGGKNTNHNKPEASPIAPPDFGQPTVVPQRQAYSSSLISEKREKDESTYPKWPWWKPVHWIRAAALLTVMRPLVKILANPKVVWESDLATCEPMLIVCNHVTAYDGPILEFALPSRLRYRVATAMSGEMLADYRHFRNPNGEMDNKRFMLFGPLAYFLVTMLFNVFPLPRRRNFQRSFAHAGEALDKGFNVLVFPEGTRSATGDLIAFRPGIGLLVKQSHAAVLPVAIRGLGELKGRGHGWFRPGKIEVHLGTPIRFQSEDSAPVITERLRSEVARLLLGQQQSRFRPHEEESMAMH